MNPILETLQNKQLIWRGFQQAVQPAPIATGYAQLDNNLAGGLPNQGVVEIKTLNGIGEIRVFAHYLAQVQKQGLIIFVAPPALVASEFLLSIGLDISQVYILTPENESDALWCVEHCLKSGCCKSILLWHTAHIALHQIKRLMLAAEKGQSCLLLYRPLSLNSLALPVNMSLRFYPHQQGLEVVIDKCRSRPPLAAFILDMHQQWQALTLPIVPKNIGLTRVNTNAQAS